MSNHRIVFSTDPKDKILCSICKKHMDDCRCESSQDAKKISFTVCFRIEKNGRGGKTVTVMTGWPRDEGYLKDMCKLFKSKCGGGGTFKVENSEGYIEIQGDHRELLKKILDSKGIRYKGM